MKNQKPSSICYELNSVLFITYMYKRGRFYCIKRGCLFINKIVSLSDVVGKQKDSL